MAATAREARAGGLDLLRIAMALAVLVYHFGFRGGAIGHSGAGHTFPAIDGVVRYGYLGVPVFFAISGYVIAWSAERGGVWSFARGRFVRIWPTFVLCMTLTAIVCTLAPANPYDVTLRQWLANLLIWPQPLGEAFVDGAYWSIVYEMIFYGWVAIGLLTGVYRRALGAAVAAWLVVIALNETVLFSSLLRTFMLTDQGGYFVFGLALRQWHVSRRRGWLAAMGLGPLLGLICSMRQTGPLEVAYATPFDPDVVALVVVGGLALVWAAATFRPPALATPAIALAGATSYPLYLLHQNMGYVAMSSLAQDVPPALALALVAGAMIALATAFAWAVEPRAQRLVRGLLDEGARRLLGWLDGGAAALPGTRGASLPGARPAGAAAAGRAAGATTAAGRASGGA